jgi:hypothetical protein
MCNCMKRINKDLERDKVNTRIVIPIMFNFKAGVHVEPKAIIATEKADTTNREKAKKFFASYCPFCGVKYTKPEAGGDGYLK